MKHVITLILLTIVSTLCLPAQSHAYTVDVGYADNLRPSGFFPATWLGDLNVVSQTPSGQSLDTGAIRIDNTAGATALTITNFTVTFGGGQVFSIWNPLTINPGMNGIFTQTGSYNFDTSDFGYFGGGPVNVDATHPLGGFTNPQGSAQIAANLSWAPVVSFTENGNAVTYTDTGHILDTFGYDLINLPPPGGDGNESINWTLIGQGGSRGGTSPVPEPGTMMLLGTGFLGLVVYGKRRKNNKG